MARSVFALRRLVVALTCALSLVIVSAVAVSASAGGASRLHALGTAVAHSLSGPAVSAEAAGAVSQVLPSVSIRIGGTAKLVNSVLVMDQVTITCGAFIFESSTNANFELVEAVGGTVTHSFASLQSYHCDGAPHNVSVSFLASNVPFIAGGDAAVGATANACGTTPNFQSICQNGQATAPVTIKR